MIPLDTLITPMTEEEVLERFIALLETLGLPASRWFKGGSLRTILRVVAILYAQCTILMAAAIRSGFLDLAEGNWLTLVAYYVYGVERKPATRATGFITLTNVGGGLYEYGIGELVVLKRVSATVVKAYRNTDEIVLNPGSTLEDIGIEAVEIGTGSSAGPGEVDEFETFLSDDVTVTNPDAVWASDEESDPELRVRCRAKLGTISPRGPRDAYEYAATSAKRPDGSFVDINRVSVSPSSSLGIVTTYVASPSGAPLPTDIDYAAEAIEAQARPPAATSVVLAATNVPLSRTLTVWALRTPGLAASDYETLVLKRLEIAMKLYPIGGIAKTEGGQGYLYADFIAGVAKSAHDSVFDIDGTGVDLELDPGEVAVLSVTLDVRIREASRA